MGLVFGLVVGFLSILCGPSVQAAPVVEQIDRYELNWSTMRLRFYGETTVSIEKDGFDGVEKSATDEGLSYVLDSLSKVRAAKGLSDEQISSLIAEDLTKQSFVSNTIFQTDGLVRVDLESSLSRALDGPTIEFIKEDPSSEPSEGTAIVLNVTGLKGPLLRPEIMSTDGELVFGAKNVARSAYKKHMTGRWFFKNSSELKSFIGSKPIEIEAVVDGEGRIVVTKDAWSKLASEHPRLLEEAKIAYVIQGSSRKKS